MRLLGCLALLAGPWIADCVGPHNESTASLTQEFDKVLQEYIPKNNGATEIYGEEELNDFFSIIDAEGELVPGGNANSYDQLMPRNVPSSHPAWLGQTSAQNQQYVSGYHGPLTHLLHSPKNGSGQYGQASWLNQQHASTDLWPSAYRHTSSRDGPNNSPNVQYKQGSSAFVGQKRNSSSGIQWGGKARQQSYAPQMPKNVPCSHPASLGQTSAQHNHMLGHSHTSPQQQHPSYSQRIMLHTSPVHSANLQHNLQQQEPSAEKPSLKWPRKSNITEAILEAINLCCKARYTADEVAQLFLKNVTVGTWNRAHTHLGEYKYLQPKRYELWTSINNLIRTELNKAKRNKCAKRIIETVKKQLKKNILTEEIIEESLLLYKSTDGAWAEAQRIAKEEIATGKADSKLLEVCTFALENVRANLRKKKNAKARQRAKANKEKNCPTENTSG